MLLLVHLLLTPNLSIQFHTEAKVYLDEKYHSEHRLCSTRRDSRHNSIIVLLSNKL